ncbi:hypothetical protein T08_1128 [Trichinella sp. T8]|nr:hypothetical protein T08_1128 [Trichinella sp. T8]
MEKVLRTTRDMYSSTLVEVDEQRQFFKFNLLAADSSGISSIRLIEKCRPSVAKFSSNSSFIYSDVLKAHHPKYTAFSSRRKISQSLIQGRSPYHRQTLDQSVVTMVTP